MIMFDEKPERDPHSQCIFEINTLKSRVRELEDEKLVVDEHFKLQVEGYMETINQLEAERDRLKEEVTRLTELVREHQTYSPKQSAKEAGHE